jgi:hypothetical protein
VFEQAITDARSGLPAVVLVSGDAGIGKTTIVSEGAARSGVGVYLGRSTHIGGDIIPLAPLASCSLRSLACRSNSWKQRCGRQSTHDSSSSPTTRTSSGTRCSARSCTPTSSHRNEPDSTAASPPPSRSTRPTHSDARTEPASRCGRPSRDVAPASAHDRVRVGRYPSAGRDRRSLQPYSRQHRGPDAHRTRRGICRAARPDASRSGGVGTRGCWTNEPSDRRRVVRVGQDRQRARVEHPAQAGRQQQGRCGSCRPARWYRLRCSV